MAAQDFNFLLATDSYKVSEPVVLETFRSISDFLFQIEFNYIQFVLG